MPSEALPPVDTSPDALLVADLALLTELHRQDTAATVRLNKRRIIAVRGDIHHALRGNAHQVDRCGYDYVPSH